MTKERFMGRRYDGGRSPLNINRGLNLFEKVTGDYKGGGTVEHTLDQLDDTVMHAVTEPNGGVLDKSEPFNTAQPTSWSDGVQAAYDSILTGKRQKAAGEDHTSKWVDHCLKEWGLEFDQVLQWSKVKRMKLCNKLVREAQKAKDAHYNELLNRMLSGTPDLSVPGGYVPRNDPLANYEADNRGGLPKKFLRGYPRDDVSRAARTALHVSLREWAAGPLTLEHPQGSSYHHLVEYELKTSEGKYAKAVELENDPQLFVVEMDWARTFVGYDLNEGEAPLPFPRCVFEFRISGVRVLAFYEEDEMFCVYGRGGVWVCDDYNYDVWSGRATAISKVKDSMEFPRVHKLVTDNVRVATIMIDANIAEMGTPRKPGDGLVKKRIREGKAPPRAYYVVDLKNRKRYSNGYASGVATGIHMRGHMRRGTWVHYDDPDSGSVQYIDSGGFYHSRTWRRWHFAGDLNNMVEKEYRL